MTAHGEILIETQHRRILAMPCSTAYLGRYGWFLIVQAERRRFHLIVLRRHNRSVWRQAQVLWRWHPRLVKTLFDA